jgi:NitT/TauT family transport system ATP-binding protein
VPSRVRISVRDLSKTFRQGAREVPAVSAVSLDVREREFVAIVGPSGCGKSTVLNMIGGLIAPSAGEILVDGQPVLGAPPATVGYVFQKDTVFPWRTVERNIALGLEYRNVPAAQRVARVREAIALAGLQGFEDAYPATLSGGMRQRVALMRSLVIDPEILLMDEPFGALDTHTLADRVVVMTRRPGRIKQIYDVKLPRPRDVIHLRETDEYSREYSEIWHALGEEFRAPTP